MHARRITLASSVKNNIITRIAAAGFFPCLQFVTDDFLAHVPLCPCLFSLFASVSLSLSASASDPAIISKARNNTE